MQQQLELFGRSNSLLTPEVGRTEPRFWVKRMVIWSEPGVMLRPPIELRPGLNIVWSPDPEDRDATDQNPGELGHGSGKTLFCRLLRYCLGEDQVANEEQRRSIAMAYRRGLVGVEVVVDGATWSVVRSIGVERYHVASTEATLEELARCEEAHHDIAPFVEAVTARIISSETARLLPDPRAWLVALAWLTRDQECRFGSLVEWRATGSDSDSPARNFSGAEHHLSLRALLGTVNAAEHARRAEGAALRDRRDREQQRVLKATAEAQELRARLGSDLKMSLDELTPDRLGADVLHAAAVRAHALLLGIDAANDGGDLDALRAQRDDARRGVNGLERQLSGIEAKQPTLEELQRAIRGEVPGLLHKKDTAENPVCKLCDVPLTRILASGRCTLSDEQPDVESIRRRIEANAEHARRAEADITENRRRHAEVEALLLPARHRFEAFERQVRGAEQATKERQDELYRARRVVDASARLLRLHDELERTTAAVAELSKKRDQKVAAANTLRDDTTPTLDRTKEMFRGVVRRILGPNAVGELAITHENRFVSRINLGGERSTAAIDSLKVIAFDLTALCLSIEGATHVPAFLVHDSPREADLGNSLYHKVFRFVRSLEPEQGTPLFQYIVTTTTRPPPELRQAPWHVLTLEGTPAEKRLLLCDL